MLQFLVLPLTSSVELSTDTELMRGVRGYKTRLFNRGQAHSQLHEVLHSTMVTFVQRAAEGLGQPWQGWMKQRIRVHCNKVLDNIGYVTEEVSVSGTTM